MDTYRANSSERIDMKYLIAVLTSENRFQLTKCELCRCQRFHFTHKNVLSATSELPALSPTTGE